MTDFTELWPGGPRFAQSEHFPLGTDSVLLADFVPLAGARRGVDLGCGGGILALLLLTRAERLHMTGLEILPAAAATAAENMRETALAERSEILCGDIRAVRELFPAGSFDLAVMIEGKTMREVALFVAEKLAPMESVISTATHFVLRKYKDKGLIMKRGDVDIRSELSDGLQ